MSIGRIGSLLVTAALVVACDKEGDENGGGDGTDGGDGAGDAVQACIDQNLPEDGHGYESDADDCAQPPPPEPPVDCPPVDPGVIQDECVADDNPCPGTFISRDAALCIAELEGLEEGIAEWTASLVYNYSYHRPIWAVDNTTYEDECESRGDGLAIDAVTGEVLDSYGWNSIC